MSKQIKLTLIPDSAFLMGGMRTNPAVHAVTAFDNEGMPFLPATAVKGALRMEFEAFVRGVAETGQLQDEGKNIICDLETKNDEEDGEVEYQGCSRCLTCKLFGGGNEVGTLRFNAGVLTDKSKEILKDLIHEIRPRGRREGVSISRTLGKAREGSYYSTLTFPDLRGVMELSFDASIDLHDSLKDERRYLKVFFGFLEKTGLIIGSGKSTGLGHFKVKWKLPEEKEDQSARPVYTSRKDLKLFKVTLKAKEPLVIGSTKNRYIIDTMPYIPTSTMGGSIGFGLVRQGIGSDMMGELFNLEEQKSRLSPFNFYRESMVPKTASTMRPKGTGYNDTQELDILLKDFIIKRAIKRDAFVRDDIQGLYNEIYKSKLQMAEVCKPPHKTYITKIGIDRQLQRAGDGLLYSMETINAGTTFMGWLIAGEWVKEVLEKKHLYIGAKRTRGCGKTYVECVEELKPGALLNFDINSNPMDEAVKGLLKSYAVDLPTDAERTFYALDLLFDFFIPGETSDEVPGKQVWDHFKVICFKGMDIEIEKAYTRTFWQGGYDFRKKEQKPLRQMIGAGSTFLVSIPTAQDGAFQEHLNNMIRDSVNFNWDSTPLFWVNNPVHLENGGKG